jgi:hypothetical protein
MPSTNVNFKAHAWALSAEVMAGRIKAWQLQPPKATLREMEAAVDARLARLQARRRQDVALARRVADVRQASGLWQPGRAPRAAQDEELAWLPGQLTPSVQDSVVWWGTWMPCAQAAEAVPCFTGMRGRKRAGGGP